MTQEEVFDAVVVGAGIAGSVCALQLARQGHEVVLLERGAEPVQTISAAVGYDDVAFMHHALPGTCIDTVDTRTEVLGATWGLPLYINAMTGGTPKTAAINADLARAAAGAGRCRPVLCGRPAPF